MGNVLGNVNSIERSYGIKKDILNDHFTLDEQRQLEPLIIAEYNVYKDTSRNLSYVKKFWAVMNIGTPKMVSLFGEKQVRKGIFYEEIV